MGTLKTQSDFRRQGIFSINKNRPPISPYHQALRVPSILEQSLTRANRFSGHLLVSNRRIYTKPVR